MNPPFEENSHYDLLNHQVDTISIILSSKFSGMGQKTSYGTLDLHISNF